MNNCNHLQFDMAPPTAMIAAAPTIGAPVPGVFPNIFPLTPGQHGTILVMPVQAMTQQMAVAIKKILYAADEKEFALSEAQQVLSESLILM
ncbi:splicing factor U2af large subunit B-like isoform X1 [Beta vulgaris subsp. vulgaris]|uniref:splicing factor U2af large subunit B-like isoform X1 n=2 Tax=Beta vulgaris subsp. vulgaris TaxID=3555 RepID=UPI002036B40D|nr:splicing factor U2af large subunit B-like isoform X1 [Beta vulgaris subsp. vulgaris]XP_048492496.1 splicing factor U2af large subunit B-like isoform X1 [Beta vulgaris subsp. vulgaris]XP_048492498.1 splicing factor U2af large subunit B-like isoform X1 [Beta vulgaris subsp. vulgaris]